MKEKIKWYQEVLELEPGSKVFFPYARCLAQVQEKSRAITLLRQGLAQHPEFLEARLFLAQLLHEEGDSTACEVEVARLAEVLTAYPGFWDAWGQAAEERTPALAFPLAYLAAAFRQQSLSLNQIFELGLSAARRGAVTEPPRKAPARPESVQEPEASPRPLKVERAKSKGRATASRASAPSGASPHGGAPGSPRDEDDLPVETVSVRTRSMAEVLAEQGDFSEAIAIYHELLSTAGPRDAATFKRRLRELTALADDNGPSVVAASTPKAKSGQSTAPAVAPAATSATPPVDADDVADISGDASGDDFEAASSDALADISGDASHTFGAASDEAVASAPAIPEPMADVTPSAGDPDLSVSKAETLPEHEASLPDPGLVSAKAEEAADISPAPEAKSVFAAEPAETPVAAEPEPASALETMSERNPVSVPEATTAKSPSENPEPPKAPEGLRATLELLAQRLEARAR